MVPCPRRNKLSKKYIRDKVEIMVALFFEKWKSVDKLWCLWTNYGSTLQVIIGLQELFLVVSARVLGNI